MSEKPIDHARPHAAPEPIPSARERQRADALRANLRRRKAQAREREAGSQDIASKPVTEA
jgi:hypothetical protein